MLGRQSQFRIGFDKTTDAIVSFGLMNGLEYSFLTGQSLDTKFEGKRFEVSLGVEKNSPRGTYVADFVEFFILVQVDREQMPMKLEVTTSVTYERSAVLAEEEDIRNEEARTHWMTISI
jgi:hypothetical protein